MESQFSRYNTFVEWTLATAITARWFWRLTVDVGTEHLQLGFVLSRPVPSSRKWRAKIAFLIGTITFELYLPDPENADDLEPEYDAEIREDVA